NGAMIAWAALERFARGQRHTLDAPARGRWPLDETSKPKVGHGRKGPKA
ncbi:MAG TPA: tRNA (adenosine(37)-N6)-threonylcarbamoyltransferase complex transferase subunit TsaD, partial [Sphingomonadales bacterium]|nr:tRNA (adenosine(37)-N6)-threonylcarbamoyltransferase complex transferase subunit TsaD [Sphingomonadales bacterium]